MGRLILLGLAVLVLVWLLRRALGGPRDDAQGAAGAAGAPGDLVPCAHCGLLLPRGEARTVDGAQYCSEQHARLGPRRP
jgi:uncharacterized protein